MKAWPGRMEGNGSLQCPSHTCPIHGALLYMRAMGTEVVVTEAAGFKCAVGQHLRPWNHSVPGQPLEGLLLSPFDG